MRRRQTVDAAAERGFSLVEVVVGVFLLLFMLMGLGAASGYALKQTTRSKLDIGEWALLQAKMDSLIAVGAASVTNGSDVINGQALQWQVQGGSPKHILVVFDRTRSDLEGAISDTLVLYLSNGS